MRGNPKLSTAQVSRARKMALKRNLAHGWIAKLAREYGVARTTLICAIAGRSFKELSTPPVPAGRRLDSDLPRLPRRYLKGDEHKGAALNATLVTALRKLAKSKKATPGWIERHARKHGVSRAAVWAAVYGQTWKHLPEAPAKAKRKKVS